VLLAAIRAEVRMSRRLTGLVLIVIGVVALAWGGVFWTDRDTIVDAGPLQVQTEETEGFALPPILGVIALVGGIILVAVPTRTRT
jgi:uncharacterized membrane protein YidH (DUF202 family)